MWPRPFLPRFWLPSLLLGLLAIGPAPGLLAADSADERFVEGLRQRRLHELAEAYCLQRLSSPEVSPRQAAELVIQLIQVYTQQAFEQPLDQRQPLWEKAQRAAEDFQRQHPANPRQLLVRVQQGLTSLAQGELARQEAQVAAQPDQAFEAARAALRQAVKQLSDLSDQIETTRLEPHRRPPPADSLSDFELVALQNNVRHQLARAYRNRALCYPPESDDRVAALTQAIQSLQTPLSQIDAEDPLLWKIRLEQLVCYRLLGSYQKAAQYAAALQQSSAPLDIQQQARAEATRIELAAGDPEAAVRRLSTDESLSTNESQQALSADLDFARLEAAIAMWRRADQQDDAKNAATWRERSASLVQSVEAQHGPYWGRRAEQLLLHAAGERGGAGNIEILSRTADDLFRKERLDEAVDAYDKAAAAALRLSQDQTAFELYYKAALIERKKQNFQQSSLRLTQLAQRLERLPRASQAHLLGVFDAAQVARQNQQFPPNYLALLEDHLRRWPNEPTADQARIWLGAARESTSDWSAARDAYQAVAPASPHLAEAIRGAERCWLVLLAQRQSAGQSWQDEALQAVGYFEQIVFGSDGRPPAEWNPAQRLAALAAARLRLQFARAELPKLQNLLAAALAGAPPPDPRWKAAAQLQLAVTRAVNSPHAPITPALGEINWPRTSREQTLQTIRLVASLLSSPQKNAALAQLQLELIDALPRATLGQDASPTTTDRQALQRMRAEALVALGREEQARREFAQLAQQNPRNASLQEQYAWLLSRANDPATLRLALEQWRRVARGHRANTKPWYQAKYQVAELQFRLGEKEKAGQLIRYVLATSTRLRGEPEERMFQDLLKRCP